MIKVLVTGPTGMLGTALIRTFVEDEKYAVFGMGRSLTQLLPAGKQVLVDFSEPTSVKVIDIDVDVIIHTAALTDLNLCEVQPELAYKINVESTAEIAAKLKRGGTMFYISTDSVFDGKKGSYTESDVPMPLNTYAKTKLEGERVSKERFAEATIIRTNIYGFHEPLKNSLAEWAFQQWGKKKPLSGFTDVIFNALYTGQLSKVIKFMVDNRIKFPILNVASREYMSKYEFLNALRAKLGISKNLLTESSSDQFPSPISRPLNTSLDVSLLETFHESPSVIEGLDQWINEVPHTNVNN